MSTFVVSVGQTVDEATLGIPDGAVILLEGDDTITVENTNAVVVPEGGGNTIVAPPGDTADVAYWDSPNGIVANLDTGAVSYGNGETDTLIGTIDFSGSNFNDSLTGPSTGVQMFYGSSGNDVYYGNGIGIVNYNNENDAYASISYNAAASTWTIVKNFPDGTSGTDTLHGIEAVVLSDTTIINKSTQYFSATSTALPNFAEYYSSFGGYGGGILFQDVTPFYMGGNTYLAIFLDEFQPTFGVVTNGPTPNREIILEAGPNGTFIDVTAQLLGSANFSINGVAADVSVADINGDGQPDIIIAESREDGRAENGNGPYSENMWAQSQVEVSQPNGTFQTINIGSPIWGAQGSVSVEGSDIVLAGNNNLPDSVEISSGSFNINTAPVYEVTSTGAAFVETGQTPGSLSGSVLVSPTQVVTCGYEDLSSSYYAVFALASLGADGTWSLTQAVNPFPQYDISNFVTWSDYLQNSLVCNVDGNIVFTAGFGVLGSFAPISGAAQAVVTFVEGKLIAAPEADGNYHESDGIPYSHLMFWNVVDNQLVPATNIKLIGEVRQGWVVGASFLDLTGNGLLDLVVEQEQTSDGAPVIYMNEGNGVFIRVDPDIFPNVEAAVGQGSGNTYSTLVMVNGSYEVISTPLSVADSQEQPVVAVPLQSFPQGVFAMSAADLSANLDVLESVAAAGNLTSIRLTDAGTPTLYVTPEQANQDATVLHDIISNYTLVVGPSVSALAAVSDSGAASTNAGHLVTITMNLSEPVTVTGTPTLQVNDNEVAYYTGGSGTNALSFVYVPIPTDNAADLQVTGLNVPNGVSIQDATGNSLSGPVAGDLGLTIAGPVTPATVAQEINGLYVTLYGLAATQAGMAYWENVLQNFDPSAAASTPISVNDETYLGQQMTAGSPIVNGTTYFTTLYPASMSDMAFVQALYQNMSDFVGTVSGDNYWYGLLQQMESSNGGNVIAARESIAGQFVHDFMSNDLTLGAAAWGLSQSDYTLLVNGQQTLLNKSVVSQYYANETQVNGVPTIIDYTTVTDPAFTASRNAAASITDDLTTVAVAITGINNAITHQDLSLA